MKRDISASLWAIWAEFILAERGDCGLSFYHGCLCVCYCPQQCQSIRFAGTGDVAKRKSIYIAQKKTREKSLFVFFGLYAPENLATPQSTLEIVRENGRRGGWLPSSIHRATPGLQGGGRSGWTVQASAVGRSCRDRWRSLLSSQRYVAPPRHAGSKDRVSVKRLAPKP